jgi:hypothetical protein
MVIVKATSHSEAGKMPSTELLVAMGNFNEELVKAGVMLSGEGLHPSARGKRVRFSGSQRTVIDGPFAQTNELVAGCWLWQVSSMDEAVAWVNRCPNPMEGDSEIEIRPLFEAADFGAELAPDLESPDERLRAEVEGAANKPRRRGRAEMLVQRCAGMARRTATAPECLPALHARPRGDKRWTKG